jgi:hypothetical protein
LIYDPLSLINLHAILPPPLVQVTPGILVMVQHRLVFCTGLQQLLHAKVNAISVAQLHLWPYQQVGSTNALNHQWVQNLMGQSPLLMNVRVWVLLCTDPVFVIMKETSRLHLLMQIWRIGQLQLLQWPVVVVVVAAARAC